MNKNKYNGELVTPNFLWGASTPDWENEASAYKRYIELKNDKNVFTENKIYYLRDRN